MATHSTTSARGAPPDSTTMSSSSATDIGRRRHRPVDGEVSTETNSTDDVVRVKFEPDDDIKDYAENTMNELLGWYGYDKLDARCLNLKNIHHFPPSSSSSSPAGRSRHEDDISEEDTVRSQSPQFDSEGISNSTSNGTITCAWCLKTGLKLFTLKTSGGETKAFCSEPCFNQCRRAAFKKSRVCDWCKHVRHTVNYVDFQDGDHQLQFCSDKCLNQYKMHIFCKETQAYLQMHPHLQEAASKAPSTAGSKLITPDLWLRDCHEPLNGNQRKTPPQSDEERAPSGAGGGQSSSSGELEDLSVPAKPDRCGSGSSVQSVSQDRQEHPPDLRKNENKEKRPAELCNTLSAYLKEDKSKFHSERRKRHHEHDKDYLRKKEKVSNRRSNANHLNEAPPAHLSSSAHFSNHNKLFPTSASAYPPSITTNSSSSLHPPAAHSNLLSSHLSSGPALPPPPPLMASEFLHPPFTQGIFPPNLNMQHQQLESFLRLQSNLRHTSPFHVPPSFQETLLPQARGMPPLPNFNPLMPPNTVMLPYPIIIPLPIPIPIPLPLSAFLDLNKKSKDDKSSTTKDSNSEQKDNKDTSDSSTNSQKTSGIKNTCQTSDNDNLNSQKQKIIVDEETNKEEEETRSLLSNKEQHPTKSNSPKTRNEVKSNHYKT